MGSRNIVLVGGAGGHGEQLARIREHFTQDSVTVIGEPELKWLHPEDTRINVGRVVDYHKPTKSQSIKKFISGLLIAFKALAFKKVDLLISTGPAMAVPVCLAAKILRIKVVHIESWSRISSISNTTKLIRKFGLADVIGYQYKDHVLAGQKNCEYWGHL